MNIYQWVKSQTYTKTALEFAEYFAHRCKQDQIQVSAGYLSYVTLMSLVPLIMVMFSIVSAFPIFGEVQQDIENFIFNNFVPAASQSIQQHLDGFVANASKMSGTAIVILFLLALLLISAVDTSLNRIWRIHQRRRAVTSFAVYWMILTLGPVLVGVSIAATSYFISLVSFSGMAITTINELLLYLLPMLASFAAFLVLYMLVPNTNVKLRYAVSGAVLATLLFELAKKGFAAYVTHLPSYEAIYGALATIPILFVWVYLSWLVVFIGAEFTACLKEFYDFKNKTANITDKDGHSTEGQ
ncbi:virulence factor BrkB family protein [Thalassotalea aquiviva]|uniref:virulence factor BrkB family protein n=1 Tax=Thalassotalea aquiviva TaxID=3242415 RepID=UPI00352A8F09